MYTIHFKYIGEGSVYLLMPFPLCLLKIGTVHDCVLSIVSHWASTTDVALQLHRDPTSAAHIANPIIVNCEKILRNEHSANIHSKYVLES